MSQINEFFKILHGKYIYIYCGLICPKYCIILTYKLFVKLI